MLEDLLQQCTVKLSIPTIRGWGTGFFVAPGRILTCNHVISGNSSQVATTGTQVLVRWQNQEQLFETEVVHALPDPFDLALLQFTSPLTSDLPCVYLDEGLRSRDPLYLFGYPDDTPEGSPVIFSCEGLTGEVPPRIKFSRGQVRPGMSGSPLLNQRTGRVCGIVKFTRDRSIDLGGGAIPTKVILSHFPELEDLQREFHQQNSQWINLLPSSNGPSFASPEEPDKPQLDWGNAPDVQVFYGRTKELTKLRQWIVDEHCRIVAVLGMGGIGKTSLIVRSIQQITSEFSDEFEYVIWRSLRSAPPLSNLLRDLIEFLSNQQKSDLLSNLNAEISLLVQYFKRHRCLLILDNFNAILAGGEPTSPYLEGYDAYGELLQQISEVSHKSCLVLTSREQFGIPLEDPAVRSLRLQGLSQSAGLKILTSISSLSTSVSKWNEIINHYAGNPLALKIVASGIRDFVSSNVNEFLDRLHQGYYPFKDIDDLLVRHFERIPDTEQEVMYWLAIAQKSVSYRELQTNLLSSKSNQTLALTLEALQRRFLLETTQAGNYTQQPVIAEYVIERFIEEICQEIRSGKVFLLDRYPLIEAVTRDYVRETQTRLILKPLILRVINIFKNQDNLENQLVKILTNLREMTLTDGYGAGNILNFLLKLSGSLEKNSRLRDFSRLTIRQAYLQCADLYDVNFSQSSFIDSIFSEPLGSVFSVAFSPNGRFIAAGDANGEIHIWQVEDYQKIATLGGDSSLVWALTFSPDSKTLASGSDDHQVRLWDVETGECKQELKGHLGAVRAVAFSFDSRTLASGSTDQQIRLWDSETGECTNLLTGHINSIWTVSFHPHDDSIFASGGVDKTVRLWRRVTSNQWQQQVLYEHEKSVCSVVFSFNGYLLASSSHDQTIRLWNLTKSEIEKTLGGRQAHKDWIWAICFSPDNKFIASASEDQSIKIWDIKSGKCIDTVIEHAHAVRGVAFSPADGKTIVSGSYDQTVKLLEWDIDREKVQCLKTWQGLASQLRSVAFSPDGKTLASCSGDRSIRLWNINFETNEYWERIKLEEHTSWVWCTAFSPDGNILASSSDDGTVKLWNIEGNDVKLLESLYQDSRVRCLAFSPDGKFIVCGCNDHKLRIWRRNSRNRWNVYKTLLGHENWIWSVAFHPSGSVFASASEDRTIKFWDVNTWSPIKLLEGHTNMIYAISFSADGKVLASGSGDHTVKLWDVKTGECLQSLVGHSRWVWSVTFSADSKTLASSSGDHTVKLWDVSNTTTAHCQVTLEGPDAHTGWVRCIRFAPNDNYLASGSDDETIKLWDTQTGRCLITLRAKGPYAGMNIYGVKGLAQAEKDALKALGAVE